MPPNLIYLRDIFSAAGDGWHFINNMGTRLAMVTLAAAPGCSYTDILQLFTLSTRHTVNFVVTQSILWSHSQFYSETNNWSQCQLVYTVNFVVTNSTLW